MEKLNAQQILESRKVIETTGKYELKVSSVTPFERDLGNGIKQVAIVNLAAMTPYHVEEATRLFNEGLYQEATNNNMTISVRDTDYLPAKGEILECSVIEVFSKNVQENILVVGAYKGQPVKKAKNFSFDIVNHKAEQRVELKTQEEEVPAFGKKQKA